jgi:hypothetical protein
MDPQDLARFETDAAEIVGAMKELFAEFEKRLGEVVSVQRVAASETRAEGANVTRQLQELGRVAKNLVGEQRNLLTRIDREWQMHIDTNAQLAGEAQAKAFGESIARGLQGQLADLASQVETATRQFTWRYSLRWVLGIAIAIPLTVGICVSALLPSAEKLPVEMPKFIKPDFGGLGAIGLTAAQTREAVSKLSLCQAPKTNDWHACMEVDNPPRMGLGSVEKLRVVVRGM